MISKKLYGLKNYFQNLINLFETSKLPKVLMFSGDKGQGGRLGKVRFNQTDK